MGNVKGEDASALNRNATTAGVAAIVGHTERLSENVVKKTVRKQITEQIPNDDELLGGQPVTLQNDASAILATRKKELDAAVADYDWETILTKSPVRHSRALASIAMALGFPKRHEYEKAVRQLLVVNDDALAFVRGLFADLFDRLKG